MLLLELFRRRAAKSRLLKGLFFCISLNLWIIALGEERQSLLEGDIFISIKTVSHLECFSGVFVMCYNDKKALE